MRSQDDGGEVTLSIARSPFMGRLEKVGGHKWRVRIVYMCRGELDLLERGCRIKVKINTADIN
jgi:hypothetical protein